VAHYQLSASRLLAPLGKGSWSLLLDVSPVLRALPGVLQGLMLNMGMAYVAGQMGHEGACG
jgi:hypothetical protein